MIRIAEQRDLDQILDIYNEAVLHTTATFDIKPRTQKQQIKWFKEHDGKFLVLVYDLNGIITGWASLSRWSDRLAYEGTAENSIYVKEKFQRKGYGKKLLIQLLKNAKKNGLHTIIARISEGNQVSIKMHSDLGFEFIGTMKEAGKKFGRYIDVTLMQKMI